MKYCYFFHHLFDFFDLKNNNITTGSAFFCNGLQQSATQSEALVKLTVYQISHKMSSIFMIADRTYLYGVYDLILA